MSAIPRKKAVITSLLLTFTLPMIAAGWVYWYGFPTTRGTTNYGTLIQPPVQITALSIKDANGTALTDKQLTRKWMMLYVSPAVCDAACEKTIFYMRQIRTATGKDQERIRLSVLSSKNPMLDEFLHTRYPQTSHWQVPNSNDPFEFIAGSLYFVDPLGNIMMSYPAGAIPQRIFKDLTKLLKVSQIG